MPRASAFVNGGGILTLFREEALQETSLHPADLSDSSYLLRR